MAATAIDTLRIARRLKDAGVPPNQAEAMADAIGSELAIQLVTKADLDLAISGLDAGIADRFSKVEGSLATLKNDLGAATAGMEAGLNDQTCNAASSLTQPRTDLGTSITALGAAIDERLSKIESELAIMTWMTGITLALVVTLTWQSFA